MKKNIVIIYIFCIFTLDLFSTNLYKPIKRIWVYDDSALKVKKEQIESDSKLEIIGCNIPSFFLNGQFGSSLNIKYDNKEGWVFSTDIIHLNNKTIDKNLLGAWTFDYYKDVVNKKNYNLIKKNEMSTDYLTEKEFWNFFSPFKLIINNSVISYSYGSGGEVLYINSIKKIEEKNVSKLIIKGQYSEADLYENEYGEVTITYKNKKIDIIHGWGFKKEDLIKVNNDSLFKKLLKLINKAILDLNK